MECLMMIATYLMGIFMIDDKEIDNKIAAEEELDLTEENNDDTFHDALED